MPFLKVYAPNFQLSSTWKCEKDEKTNTWKVKTPSVATAVVGFTYALESGSRLIGARVSAVVGNPNGGISSLTANGTNMSKRDDGSRSASVQIMATAGNLQVAFSFRSGGKKYEDTSTHIGTLQFTNVYLEIDYEGVEGVYEDEQTTSSKGYEVPPQSVCIYDQNDNSMDTFDGVLKVQHKLSMDIQEEPTGKTAKLYVNNAKNQPDKVVLDVMMSDVYSGGGSIISNAGSLTAAQQEGFTATKYSLMKRDVQNPWTRSENAFYTLHWLKEQRRKIMVITPQFVYTDMILSSVTANHEDTTPFGWEGQITFQHAFEKVEKKKKSNPDNGGGSGIIGSSYIAHVIKGDESTQ